MNDTRALWKFRLLGLAGTSLAFYLLFWVVLGKVDIGWLVPENKMASAVFAFWRDLPFFSVEKGPAPDGNGQVVYYTVPTRQATKSEMAQMMSTNAAPQASAQPGRASR